MAGRPRKDDINTQQLIINLAKAGMTNTAIAEITGLVFALVATLGIGATALNMERKRHEREENKIRQEGAENAQHTADIITEAGKKLLLFFIIFL